MLKFITHRSLWLNLVTALVLAVVLFALFILSLNLLTHHGRSRTVPQVVGKTYADAEKILDKEGFDIVIQDSVYIDSLPPTAIIKQVPESDAVVKVNRTVYLTLNRSVAPMIDMPNRPYVDVRLTPIKFLLRHRSLLDRSALQHLLQ